MLKKVRNPFHNRYIGESTPFIHRIFVEMSGTPSNAKKALIKQTLVDWQVSVKKKKENIDETIECPFYSPSTQNLELHTFISVMKDFYNFQYLLRNINKSEGSLGGMLKKLYQSRVVKYVSEKDK